MSNTKLLENTARFRKTKRGVVTNLFQKLKGRNVVEFTLEYLHEFADCRKFDRLFNEWVKSGYDKQFKPSIDRISNKKGYLKNNIQWFTWAENRFKQTMERRSRKGAVLQLMGDKVIARFESQRIAVIKTGISQGNMSTVLNGKRNTCGGYKFKFEHPDLLPPPLTNKTKHYRMITLKKETAEAIKIEMESIPEKYQKPFNSVHEGLAVLREEYVELEQEIFFGYKKWAKNEVLWKNAIKEEAIQVAAMAARIIQELT